MTEHREAEGDAAVAPVVVTGGGATHLGATDEPEAHRLVAPVVVTENRDVHGGASRRRVAADEGDGPAPPARVVDALLLAGLVATPLALSGSIRAFVTCKALVLEAIFGFAALAAALAPTRAIAGRDAALVGVAIAASIVACLLGNPSALGVSAAAYLVALTLAAALLRARMAALPPALVLAALAGPLALDLGYSAAQALDVGVLPATRAAFGTTHGLLVGFIGNPVEHGWYLVLGTCLVIGVALARDEPPTRPRRLLALALIAATIAVLLADRARSGLLAAAAAASLAALLADAGRRRLLLALPIAATTIALGLAMGGATALRGRLYLDQITGALLLARAGVPAGPGGLARDFPEGQASLLARSPELAQFASSIEHAHCDPLELLYELGPVGLALLLGGAWLVARARPRDSNVGRGAAAALAAGVVMTLIGYPLFAPASAVLLACAVALLPLRAPRPRAPHPARVALVRLALAGLGLALVVIAVDQWRAETRVTAALRAVEGGEAERARALAHSAVAAFPGPDALFYLGNLRALTGDPEAAARALERSYAQRPRPEVAANLAVIAARRGDEVAADRWDRRAAWLAGRGSDAGGPGPW